MIYKNNDTLFMGDIRTDSLQRVAEYMGYDISNSEQLHGFIKDIAAKIKGAIQRSKANRGGEPGVYAVQTPTGTVSISDTGAVSAITPKPKSSTTRAKTAGFMDMLQKNPMLILAAGAVLVFVMSNKKR